MVSRLLHTALIAVALSAGCSTPAQVVQVQPKPAPVDPWGTQPVVPPIVRADFAKAVRVHVSPTGDPSHPGVELLVVERHDSPAVHLKWVIPGGRSLEFSGGSPTRWPEGTVDVMAEMLTEGSRGHRGFKLAAALEGHGAELSFQTTSDALVASGRVLSHELDAWLRLAREAMLEPTFEARPLKNLLTRHRARLKTLATRPQSISGRVFNRLVYGAAHPYGSPGATEASIDHIKAAHLKAARAALVQLGGSTLVVVGDVRPAELAQKLAAMFGDALGGAKVERPPMPPTTPAAPGCHVVDVPKAVQTLIVHGNPGPAGGEATWPGLVLANQVLGGSASSRLFSELRERRGLTYGVYSNFDGRRAAGDWSVSTSVRTAKAVEALKALDTELARMQRTAPEAAEVAAARRYLIGQFIMAQASGARVASRLASLRLYDRPDDFWQRWVSRLREATPQQLADHARSWMGNKTALTLLVGNLSGMRPALDARCPVMVLHDAQGRLLRHLIGSDAEMTDADRAELFAGWAKDIGSRPALRRFLGNTTRSAAVRAQALFALLSGPQDAAGPQLGDLASDWPKVAVALVPLLVAEFAGEPTAAQAKRARAARRWLLDLASPASGDGVLSPVARTAALASVATWAFAGIVADGDPALVAQLAKSRLVEADLARLGPPGLAGLEALVSTNVWRTTAAKALVAQDNVAAAQALARGYRRAFVVRRALPSDVDLELLSRAPGGGVALLLFDVYTLHRLGHADASKEPTLASVMTTLQTMIATLASQPIADGADQRPERTVLARDFQALMSHFESLLASPDPDDRWWSADHLVRYRAEKGLRIVLLGLADDLAYARSPLADEQATAAFSRFARSRIVPLGEATVRPLMLAALAGRRRIAKVIAITALRSMRDAASMTVLETHNDTTEVGAVLGLTEPLSVTQMARAAADVRKYVVGVDAAERSGRLTPKVAAVHRAEAYRQFSLEDRALAEAVSAAVARRLRTPSK